MRKSKVNVASNELDQAPKTRAAGYRKVVNLMKKEMTESINWTNIPNIASNGLDQAPKTRAARYEKKVLEPIKKDIEEAMDAILLNWGDVLWNYMNNPKNRIPFKQLLELQPGDHLSFEVKREKIVPSEGFMQTVWHPAFLWNFNNFMHNCYRFEEEWAIKPGQISTIIVVEKDAKDPKFWKIHSEQLEYPGPWAMLMKWMFFHNPNVSDEKFQEIVGTSNNKKEEIKEQIKDNINEEIEAEENEKKAEEKSKDEKKSLADTIKWWLGK